MASTHSFKKTLLNVLSLSTLFASASPIQPLEERNVTERGASGYQNSVYFANWGIYGRNYKPAQLPASQVTHVLYAFANLQSTGEVFSSDQWADIQQHYDGDSWSESGNNVYGCVKQLYLLKKKNRQMKLLLSIGGWTYSQNSNFANAAASASSRATFARTSVALMKDWGFDGVDVDWEYPQSPTEAANFVLLLRAVRAELDAYAAANAPGYHFLLTIASPAGPSHYGVLDLAGLASTIDYFNFMGYDYAGSWDSTAGHQANLYASGAATPFSTDAAVRDYVAAGVPPGKIVLGMPIYGRAFESTGGPGTPFNGVGGGSWENGVWDYKALPRAGATEYYDAAAQATYSYDAGAREMISYDTPDMVRRKVSYLKQKGLGGSMFWEASGDRVGDGSLIAASYGALGGLDGSPNLLSYPDSQYDNMKAGMK